MRTNANAQKNIIHIGISTQPPQQGGKWEKEEAKLRLNVNQVLNCQY